jgi:hypothetical protein
MPSAAGPHALLQLLCLAIVSIHVTTACLRSARPGRYLVRAAIIAVASLVAEDTCIRLYGFYRYHEGWVPFVDQMPLMVALIWPGVLLSAGELAGLLASGRAVPLVAAALVLCDASFMEPIAVHAGLWRWFAPGFFGVPPIGIVGWAAFSGAGLAVFEANDARGRRWPADLVAVLAAPAFAHAVLLATWWGALRWVNAPLPDGAVVAAAWAVSSILTALAIRRRTGVPLAAMATRLPAAAFFFVLLFRGDGAPGALVAYALAFALPYSTLTVLGLGGIRSGPTPARARPRPPTRGAG